MNAPFKVGDLVRLIRPCRAVEGCTFIGGRIVEVLRWCRAHNPLGHATGPRYGVALRDAEGRNGGEEYVRFVKADEIKPAHN